MSDGVTSAYIEKVFNSLIDSASVINPDLCFPYLEVHRLSGSDEPHNVLVSVSKELTVIEVTVLVTFCHQKGETTDVKTKNSFDPA
jgi:hypothetical protein